MPGSIWALVEDLRPVPLLAQVCGVWEHLECEVTAAVVTTQGPEAVWDEVSVDSTTCRAHVHAAGARRDSPRVVNGRPGDHALGRSRAGVTKIHAAVDAGRGMLACVLSAGRAARCPMTVPVLEAIRAAHRGRGPAPPAPEVGTGRQGLLLTSQPGLAACPPHPRHDPGHGRPGGLPSIQRLTRWAPTDLRRRDVQEPQHRGTRLQSPQAPPSPGHPLRQTRHALPGNHLHRQHQPLAQTTYITGSSSRQLTFQRRDR